MICYTWKVFYCDFACKLMVNFRNNDLLIKLFFILKKYLTVKYIEIRGSQLIMYLRVHKQIVRCDAKLYALFNDNVNENHAEDTRILKGTEPLIQLISQLYISPGCQI